GDPEGRRAEQLRQRDGEDGESGAGSKRLGWGWKGRGDPGEAPVVDEVRLVQVSRGVPTDRQGIVPRDIDPQVEHAEDERSQKDGDRRLDMSLAQRRRA